MFSGVKMAKILFSLTVIFWACILPSTALAGVSNGSPSITSLLVDALIAVVILVCFLGALSIFSLLKGGELASGWQTLAISFMILLIGEALNILDMMKIASIGDTVVLLVRLIGIGAIMLGISKIKRVLS